MLRDAGFTLQPDAAAWEDVSVEQAYDRLPEPQYGDDGDDGTRRKPPARPANLRPAAGVPTLTTRPIPPLTATVRMMAIRTRTARTRTAPPTHRRATTLPAPGRSWTPPPARATAAISAEAPVDITAEE